jgi:DNA mismatch repair protein MutS2
MERQEQETARSLRQAEEERTKAEEYRRATEKEKEKAAQAARREADRILREARQSAELVFDELADMKKKADRAEWQKMNDGRADVYRVLNETEEKLVGKKEEAAPPPDDRPPVPGDRVKVLSLGTEADVIAVQPDGTLSLQAGIMKITAPPEDVRLTARPAAKKDGGRVHTGGAGVRAETVRPEIDIRGMTSDEAIPLVQRFLDRAAMNKLTTVTVIHGKGTGALRKAVHECLKRERSVKSYRLGNFGEGEAGVTVVELR